MAGLDPAIHDLTARHAVNGPHTDRLDGRVKPGHDGESC
jgi:hypothetical protein